MRSDTRAAIRLMIAFVTPKLTMNDVMAVFELSPNSCSPSSGSTVRSRADHGADEGIQDDEQRELREVLPQSEPHLAHSPVRLRRRFTAKASGCGGRSFSTKSTNSALEAARSAGLKRRSKPIVEPGLPLRPFPHAAPPKCAGKISR